MGAAAFLSAMGQTRYALVLSEHLPNAQDRLKSLRLLFDEPSFRRSYPLIAKPAMTAEGRLLGWSNRILFTKSGHIFQATSLEAGKRGANQASVEQPDPDMPDEARELLKAVRPDLLIIDDIDNQLDTARATARKESILSTEVVPMGSRQYPLRVLILQNRIIHSGVIGRIIERKSSCFNDAIVSGPWKAIVDLKTKPVMRKVKATGAESMSEAELDEYVRQQHDASHQQESALEQYVEYPAHDIVGGIPSWPEGMSIAKCQQLIDDMGIGAFRVEMNHETTNREGALLDDSYFQQVPDEFDLKTIRERIVSVDPGGGATESGITVIGRSIGEKAGTRCMMYYVMEDLTTGPREGWEVVAVMAAHRHKCDILVEDNYGGKNLIRAVETVRDDLRRRGKIPGRLPQVHPVHASNNKHDRAVPFSMVYKEGRVWHVGDQSRLEKQWTSAILEQKGVESPDTLDSAVHGYNYLDSKPQGIVVAVGAGTDSFV